MLIDSFALMFIGWFSAILFGVLETSITIFGGYDFADPLWTVAGAEISVALLVVVFSVIWVLVTNEVDGSDYAPEEFAVIGFALLAPVLFIFVPAFEALVMWHGASQLLFALLTTFATTWIAYTA
ncbi:hypothetical protein GRS48_00445 [Halorubrum sp. JWXQ-INN 858]|uniref:hypothetical protein n=1 Tax=Halorubrum sp. JWXQ-INN 858 TaxID=2690782 RepID=UPI001358D8FD|nr:hypothetical protein [Halorubrum sp. JWXQ-INN 858]MWV63303.1 hypothetical protein [Halorubrum sp. JWXQ-INN 858]